MVAEPAVPVSGETPALRGLRHTSGRRALLRPGPGLLRRFEHLAQAEVGGGAADPAALFSPWAFLFGPFWYLWRGLWRKALLLLPLWVVPALLPDDGHALAGIAAGAQPGTEAAVYGTGLAFLLLLFSGRRVAALFTALVGLAGLLYGEIHFPYLDFGVSSAFMWLAARQVWPLPAACALYYGLTRRPVGVLVSLAAVPALLQFGLPAEGLCLPLIADAAIRTLVGLSAVRDAFRREIRGETFWW